MDNWGGQHTETKLDAVEAYLNSFQDVLKNNSLRSVYIDAFAGSGESVPKGHELPLFDEGRLFIEGSARRSLRAKRSFDRYHFIDVSEAKLNELEQYVRSRHPDLLTRTNFECGDANVVLPKVLRRLNARSERAVVFLDPFGMQIDWATMIALSKSLVDLWYLVPIVAINRMITRDGEMVPGWGEKLDRFLGDTTWRNRWYSHSAQSDLFGQMDARPQKTATLDLIEADFHARLGGLFVMSSNRLRLTKSNRVLFTLMFGCSNRQGRAATIATRIANHLLKAK